MRVLYKVRWPEGTSSAENGKFCCDRMVEAWTDGAVRFGEYGRWTNRNQDVNIFHCSPYPEGAVYSEYKIDYCPFCGEKIDVQEMQDNPQDEVQNRETGKSSKDENLEP